MDLAFSFHKIFAKVFLHLPPYPSTPPPFISPSPYPSIPILPHSLISLPPSLIPPHTPPPTASRHPPTAGTHPCSISKDLLIQFVVLPILFLPPRGSFSTHILSRVMLALWFTGPGLNAPPPRTLQVFSTISVCLLLEAACKLILLHLSALFIMRSL